MDEVAINSPQTDEEGRNKSNGRFEKGNVVARRKKGKRHKVVCPAR